MAEPPDAGALPAEGTGMADRAKQERGQAEGLGWADGWFGVWESSESHPSAGSIGAGDHSRAGAAGVRAMAPGKGPRWSAEYALCGVDKSLNGLKCISV